MAICRYRRSGRARASDDDTGHPMRSVNGGQVCGVAADLRFCQAFGRGDAVTLLIELLPVRRTRTRRLSTRPIGIQERQRLQRARVLHRRRHVVALAAGVVLHPAVRPLAHLAAVPERASGQRVALEHAGGICAAWWLPYVRVARAWRHCRPASCPSSARMPNRRAPLADDTTRPRSAHAWAVRMAWSCAAGCIRSASRRESRARRLRAPDRRQRPTPPTPPIRSIHPRDRSPRCRRPPNTRGSDRIADRDQAPSPTPRPLRCRRRCTARAHRRCSSASRASPAETGGCDRATRVPPSAATRPAGLPCRRRARTW